MTAIVLPDFTAQRARFLAAVARHNGVVTTYQHHLTGPTGEKLATDVAVLGNADASKVMFIVSGTHGVEGYYGSDSQIAWLDSLETQSLPQDTAMVFVHLINPWGAAWLCRVNEDNADLNRNFIDFAAGAPDNAAYCELHDIYTCRDVDGAERAAADAKLAKYCAERGWNGVKQIVEAGQYQFADGLYFGGTQASWSHLTLKKIIETHLRQAKKVISFDMHTGAGAWGHPMLLAVAERAYPALDKAKQIFGEWLTVVLTGAGQDTATGITATATGYVSQFMLDNLPETELLQLVVECGTYASDEMHNRIRDDHWLHLYGDPLSEQGRQMKAHFFEGFYPHDADWRELIALRTQQIFRRGWAALATL